MAAWASTQADALRRRDAPCLDWDGLADTLDSLGRILRRAKQSARRRAGRTCASCQSRMASSKPSRHCITPAKASSTRGQRRPTRFGAFWQNTASSSRKVLRTSQKQRVGVDQCIPLIARTGSHFQSLAVEDLDISPVIADQLLVL